MKFNQSFKAPSGAWRNIIKSEKRGPGRPVGRKERISINIDQENLDWLKQQELSYSKTVNRLIERKLEKE